MSLARPDVVAVPEGSPEFTRRQNLIVWLSCVGNPDHRQDPWRPLPGVPSGIGVAVSSLSEAREEVRRYIAEYDLGGGNWTGGQIYRAGESEPIARVSYNGRVRMQVEQESPPQSLSARP